MAAHDGDDDIRHEERAPFNFQEFKRDWAERLSGYGKHYSARHKSRARNAAIAWQRLDKTLRLLFILDVTALVILIGGGMALGGGLKWVIEVWPLFVPIAVIAVLALIARRRKHEPTRAWIPNMERPVAKGPKGELCVTAT